MPKVPEVPEKRAFLPSANRRGPHRSFSEGGEVPPEQRGKRQAFFLRHTRDLLTMWRNFSISC